MNQNSVQILLQSLEKKNQILDQLINHNEQQEKLLKNEELNMDRLDQMLDVQGRLVAELERLDEGFETVYDRTREEIIGNKEKYRTEIKRMQECIQQITAKIATINAGNMRNKVLMETQFKKQKQEIGKNVSIQKVARNYYNSMNNLNHVSPQFYDSKQ
ncbi:MAG: flagellar protein FliT [Lachnospiraceae bacterium]|nr:flagellar protein FliT [Lachnospiraceae bacterium]